jgi:hypothetical protein
VPNLLETIEQQLEATPQSAVVSTSGIQISRAFCGRRLVHGLDEKLALSLAGWILGDVHVIQSLLISAQTEKKSRQTVADFFRGSEARLSPAGQRASPLSISTRNHVRA